MALGWPNGCGVGWARPPSGLISLVNLRGDRLIERNDSVFFASNEAAYRGKWRVDGDLVDLGAVHSLVQNVAV